MRKLQNSLTKPIKSTSKVKYLLFPKSGSHHTKNIYPRISKIVHVRTSRHQDVKERIQHNLVIIAHPEIWCAEDWLELRTSRSRWHVCYTKQITKKKITSRGQYKEHVLSRYHRPTQNRKQYILNNNIKSTTILNRWQSTSIKIIGNNTKHTYEDSSLHTILIWEIGSSNLSILT